ncbi:hypothetical protein [Metasolibacillus sp. FSL K6-0083]
MIAVIYQQPVTPMQSDFTKFSTDFEEQENERGIQAVERET